jgi:hypothetical protein
LYENIQYKCKTAGRSNSGADAAKEGGEGDKKVKCLRKTYKDLS